MTWNRNWSTPRKIALAVWRATGFKIFTVPGMVAGGFGFWNLMALRYKPELVAPAEMIGIAAAFAATCYILVSLVRRTMYLEDTRAPEIALHYDHSVQCYDTRYSDALFIHGLASSLSEEGVRDVEVWIEGVDEIDDRGEVIRSIAIARMNLSWSRCPGPAPNKFGILPILRQRELFDILIWYHQNAYFALEVDRAHPESIRNYPLDRRYRITVGSSAQSKLMKLVVAFDAVARVLFVRNEAEPIG